jgi:hypothetical protein
VHHADIVYQDFPVYTVGSTLQQVRQPKGSEYLSLRHQSRHKWWFYPDMHEEEVILIKTFDSNWAHEPDRYVPSFHSAFDIPNTPDDAPPRTSIEARAVCIFAGDAAGPKPRL